MKQYLRYVSESESHLDEQIKKCKDEKLKTELIKKRNEYTSMLSSMHYGYY